MTQGFASLTRPEQIEWLSGSYYGMMWLGLANAAYTFAAKDPSYIARNFAPAITDTAYMPSMPDIGQFDQSAAANQGFQLVAGDWNLPWGPAISDDNSNLLYIASYGPLAGDPYFYVVGIRGTDVNAGLEGVINQLFQDMRAFTAYDWSTYLTDGIKTGLLTRLGPPVNDTGVGSPPGGMVARGTTEGFDKIAGLKVSLNADPGGPAKTVVEALSALIGSSGTPVIVTGHSLGGCQTQVMASYLAWQLPGSTVIAHPMAPPTAGDGTFAAGAVFARGSFWYNTLDLVPCAFGPPSAGQGTFTPDLEVTWATQNLWTKYLWPDSQESGPPLPMLGVIDDMLKSNGADVVDIGYSRPTGGMDINPMTGSIPSLTVMQAFLTGLGDDKTDPKGSLAQLEWQHFPPCYKLLMWEQYASRIVYFDYASYKGD